MSRVISNLAASGTTYKFLPPSKNLPSTLVTFVGGTLTGLLGVGVGEVVLPQLVRGSCMGLPLAAGTSVAIVVSTAAVAAIVQFSELAQATGGSVLDTIPWSLVAFTIPGVIIGGQIAPFIASRELFEDETIERFASLVFLFIGLLFAVKAVIS